VVKDFKWIKTNKKMDRITQINAGPEISHTLGFQVSKILFICRPYHWPGLKADIHPSPWEITRAGCMEEAAALLGNANFDLVFIEVGALDNKTEVTVQHFKNLCPGLLSSWCRRPIAKIGR
jgi:hypothetical protein